MRSPFDLLSVFLALCASSAFATPPASAPYLHAPAVNVYAHHNPDGRTILPTGRYLKPVGKHFPLAKWPHSLVLSPDGESAFVASEGVGQFITDWQSGTPTIQAFAPELNTQGQNPATRSKRRSNAGAAAFAPDGKTLYWSSGESGEIYCVDVAARKVTAAIPLNVTVNQSAFADSYAMDVKISADGAFLYCADVTNFRVVVIDTAKRQVVGSVGVGRYPYALAVSGKTVYVANIGMFQYSAIPPPTVTETTESGEKAKGYDKRGLTFPAFGFPSRDARDGVEFEGRHVPGLGDPNAPESFSVWGVSVSDPAQPKVVRRIKTGIAVGGIADNGKAVGGSAPNFLALQGDTLYVSNGNNDSIARVSLASGKVTGTTRLSPSPLVARLRGVGPSGLAISPNGRRLFVAESGINAIGVVDTQSGRTLGHIPSTWYPYRVEVSSDGKRLLVIGFRGFGNGPNAGKNIPKDPFLGMKGALSVLDVPTDAHLAEMTHDTLAYNGIVDKSADRVGLGSPVVPTTPKIASSQIKYVVFITKENHTYDAIFDRVPGANDDPTLLRWGYKQKIAAPGQPTLENVAVMTNHNALARQFTVSDNFYMEPEASGVGHRWLIGVQPDNFCQMTYTLGWDFKANSSAPGRRASFGSNGSIAPEDYPEAGSMWEHLARHGRSFRNYGEGFEFAGVLEDEDEHRTGAREVVNIPMSKVVYDNTCRDFPIFNMNIPDQYRAYWFMQDFSRLRAMPSFINIAICNDHGTGPNPKKGYPYVASWMADNDLALGRIVDFLSHTPYWKNMAIFVTQDDSGGEPDHVDAQRSVLLCISPWAKHGYVSHRLTTIVSMHKTLYELLGLPPLNLFDALANDFADCFTTKPDFRPYNHVGVDPRIFDPEKAKDPTDPDYKMARETSPVRRDDADEEAKVLRAGQPKP